MDVGEGYMMFEREGLLFTIVVGSFRLFVGEQVGIKPV